MLVTLPLVFIALGSVALVALREGRLLVAALFAQWVGLALLLSGVIPGARVAWVELVVAMVCSVLLGWTVWTLRNMKIEELPGLDESHRASWLLRQERRNWYARESGLADQALLWVIALAGGVAGFGLARLYPLGGSEEVMLAFYWVLFSGALSLVVHSARDLLKLGVGLVALLNSIALLVETMAIGTLNDVTLGLLGLCRVALVLVIAYLLVVLKVTFLDADLDDIFDARAGITADDMALVVAGAGEGDYFYPEADDPDLGAADEGRRQKAEGSQENSADLETTPVGSEEEGEKGEVPAGG